ncbi:META domain-containing protein [Salinibacterium sp. G-O1]|uniref:META domain-containing protein n=1 Tax=Salinibacterium sp. G-O1 TaxID=3046208 RepID=UPI0024BAFDBC|nr:META domain-containing protein [Salinibacterium sp. G-O1]MDJ0335697.1 META domain-containing protein [Salinibacterium sp. G-O1]
MFGRLLATVAAVALISGCTSSTPPPEVESEGSPAVGLVGLWRVAGAEGETANTWLRLTAGEFQLSRDCGIISGSWRGAGGLMLASVYGASGLCASASLPEVPWLESAEGYAPTEGGWELTDAAGSPVAELIIDGAPDLLPDGAEFFAQPPEVTDETRAYFADAVPLPADLAVGSIAGRWLPEGVSVSTGAKVDFAVDGTWTGSDGCNVSGGRWAAGSGGGFLASSGLSTLMACDGAPVPGWVSQAQLAGLDGEVLVLLDRGGVELGRLVKA